MGGLPTAAEMVDALDRIAETVSDPYLTGDDVVDIVQGILRDVNR